MTIYRHDVIDEAHRIVINAINKGHHGSFLIIADVQLLCQLGKATTLQALKT